MSATLIQTKYQQGTISTTSITFTGVEIGDLLVVSGQQNTGTICSIVDTAGNSYAGPFVNTNGFGFVAGFYAYSIAAGTITVTVTLPQVPDVIGAVYRNAGGFDQAAGNIGWYSPGSGLVGTETSSFTLADTLIVTFLYQAAAGDTPLCSSLSGDTLELFGHRSYLFDRLASGPGSSSVIIEGMGTGLLFQLPVLVFTFSVPLDRPSGTTEQYAVRGGVGFANATTPLFLNKDPLVASLPYAVELGSLVVVSGSYAACDAAVVSVSDDYGNVYTQAVYSPGEFCQIYLFYTVVTKLPPAGQVFRAKMQTNELDVCGSSTYQTTTIAIAEKLVVGTVSAVAAAPWASNTPSAPNITQRTSSLTVPPNTFLLAVAIYNPGANQESATWSPLEGYTIQQQANFIQFGEPYTVTNFSRVGNVAIMTKSVDAGSYDAQSLVTIEGNFGDGGSIALLGATIVGGISLACPIGNTAQVGVPYTGMLLASGGTPPYTFAIL